MLNTRVHKEGDVLTGFKILSSQDELFKTLNDLHLYQHGNFDDSKVKHYARHYFKDLCEKSREIVSQKLIQEYDFIKDGKENKQKHDKKQNKKNRKK